MTRIGIGYDVHRLVAGRRLVLGGETLDYALGLEGHSDADVLVHAVMDALLGACALGDIGMLYPDNDPAYLDADSLALLEDVVARVEKAGYRPVNIDAVIVAQRPRMMPHIPAMRENIARACGLDASRVSVKATTTERLGFEGRGEGIAAQAAVLVEGGEIG